jgi:hypothetical protein
MVGAEISGAADRHGERFMSLGVASGARMRQRKRCSTKPVSQSINGLFLADPAKALVMTCIGRFVADGFAEWNLLDNGDIQLRFNTGETFLVTKRVIVRLA